MPVRPISFFGVALIAIALFWAFVIPPRIGKFPDRTEGMLEAMNWLSESGYKGEVMAVGQSGSMGAKFTEHDWVVVEYCTVDQVRADSKIGDVIVFILEGRATIHRAVARRPDGSLIAKGDTNLQPDPVYITNAELIGRVVHKVEFEGR